MKAFNYQDKENISRGRKLQATPNVSHSSLEKTLSSPSKLAANSLNLQYSISPKSLSQNLLPTHNATHGADFEKLATINQQLLKENEVLKRSQVTSAQEKELSSKLAALLADNSKLNHALEKLKGAYEKEKLKNSNVSSERSLPVNGLSIPINAQSETLILDGSKSLEAMQGGRIPQSIAMLSSIPTESKGMADSKLSVSHISSFKKDQEDYEKNIVTLFVQNDKLNDALEQKMGEIKILSAKIDEVQYKEPTRSGADGNDNGISFDGSFEELRKIMNSL